MCYFEYVAEITKTNEFKKLKELKKIIDNKYSDLIVNMKNLEAKYLELKEYEKYRPEVKNIKNKFIEAKALLYAKEEVKEYFNLENKLQCMLNDDINELKEAISPHFTKSKNMKI